MRSLELMTTKVWPNFTERIGNPRPLGHEHGHGWPRADFAWLSLIVAPRHRFLCRVIDAMFLFFCFLSVRSFLLKVW
jgi:hypothetical protein